MAHLQAPLLFPCYWNSMDEESSTLLSSVKPFEQTDEEKEREFHLVAGRPRDDPSSYERFRVLTDMGVAVHTCRLQYLTEGLTKHLERLRPTVSTTTFI